MSKRIAILDSGVHQLHPAFSGREIKGFSITVDENGDVNVSDDFSDENGHGTAVYDLVSRNAPSAEITNIKIYRDEETVTQHELEIILEYIFEHCEFDIINLSMGIIQCDCTKRLQAICADFQAKGTVLFSAFDNSGAASAPAMLQSVVGVDGDESLEKDEVLLVKGSIVNVVMKQNYMKVAWLSPAYCLVNGTSFLTAKLTGMAAETEYHSKDELLEKLCTRQICVEPAKEAKIPFEIVKAAVFPFNKEVHALARFENLLTFQMVAYYSVRVMGNVGKELAECVRGCTSDKTIRDIQEINWEEIDTLIIGHTDACSKITHVNYKKELLEEAKKRKVNVYAFDDQEICLLADSEEVFLPKIDERMLEKRFGKLYQNNIPILSIVGTNSKQGKYTLQLMMRERMLRIGYKVGQIGTEPTALLFGMDEMFACGYNAAIELNPEQIYSYVNQMVHNVVEKDVDILLAGSQTALLGYNNNNVLQIPLSHRLYFEALRPDGIVLCVNMYDEKEYVEQTIKLAEGLSGGKVIALACLPMPQGSRWYVEKNAQPVSEEMREKMKEEYEEYSLFWLDSEEEIDRLTEHCINFFAE